MARLARVLVTNDDGINAPGLEVLERVAEALADEVIVVAPEVNQSGAGHSLTLRHPLRVRSMAERRFAVDGTPTDCVTLAIHHILKGQKVDLVLSGVNRGSNLADDVTYSGTVAAAMEATLLGLRAIALSQVCEDRRPTRWATAEHWGRRVVERCLDLGPEDGWAGDVLLNVNFPDRAAASVRGVRVTRQGQRAPGEALVERIDPRGEPYVWIGGLRGEEHHAAGTDLAAVAEGFVSVTPVHLDLTHHASLERLRDDLED